MIATHPGRTSDRVGRTSRLLSLDVLRGLTMAAMVVVNNPGDWNNVYPPLLHAEWNGWTPTDLIFPFFIFIVGVSITLSTRSQQWGSILRRGALIFATGLFLNGYPSFNLETWRIPGVLQRIAICYVVAAAYFKLTTGTRERLGNAVASFLYVSEGLALAIVYYFCMSLLAPPGGVAGDLTPEGNLGAYVDRAVFGNHMWKPRWDPEGLLSTLPAIATTLLGVAAGVWLRSAASPATRVLVLAAAGIGGIAAGYAWDSWFPINKSLWTSSFVLFTAGAAALLLSASYWLIDVRGIRRGVAPFVILGTNALALYVVSSLLAGTLEHPVAPDLTAGQYIYQRWFAPLAAPRNASLLYALTHLVLLFALLAWMHRRRIFLRL